MIVVHVALGACLAGQGRCCRRVSIRTLSPHFTDWAVMQTCMLACNAESEMLRDGVGARLSFSSFCLVSDLSARIILGAVLLLCAYGRQNYSGYRIARRTVALCLLR